MDAGIGASRNKTWSFTSVPSVPKQEQDKTFQKSWSMELTRGLGDNIVKRITDYNDFDEEADGLMSNDSAGDLTQDGYTARNLSISHHHWPPKTYNKELLQAYQSEAKIKHNSSIPSNFLFHKSLNKVQEGSVDRCVEDFSKKSYGPAVNHQWLSKLPHGDDDSHSNHSPKLKSGVQAFKDGNSYLTQILQSQIDKSSTLNNKGTPTSDILGHQKSSFNTDYQDISFESNVKPTVNKQQLQHNFNQHLSCSQSLEVGGCGALTDIHKQLLSMHTENSVDEKWRSSNGVSAQSSPPFLFEKFGMVMDVGQKGGMADQDFNLNTFCQHPEPYSSLKPDLTYVNLSNKYQNRINNRSGNVIVKQDVLQSQVQNQVTRPRKKSVEEMVHMPVNLVNGLSAGPLNNTYMNSQAKAQEVSHFDHLGGLQSPRFNEKNGKISPWNPKQCMPHLYPASDFGWNLSNPTIAGLRSMQGYRNGVPNTDVHDKPNGNAAILHLTSQMRNNREESTYHEGSPLMMVNKGKPETQLGLCIDQCFMQWQGLEMERKKTEFILTKTFVGKKILTAPNVTMPKIPPNPTRVDHLLVKHVREQLKVADVLNWMDCLRNKHLPFNISAALNKHRMVICWTNARHEEILRPFKQQQQHKAQILESRDILMIMALRDLAATTRKLRTALWCALQLTLPRPEKTPEVSDNGETSTETSASTKYSFK